MVLLLAKNGVFDLEELALVYIFAVHIFDFGLETPNDLGDCKLPPSSDLLAAISSSILSSIWTAKSEYLDSTRSNKRLSSLSFMAVFRE